MFHCYICEKLLIVYVYACFGGSPAGEADKIGKKKIKKKSYVPRCSSNSWRNINSVMFFGSPRNIRAYVPQCGLCFSVPRSSAPMSTRTYVSRDMLFGYISRFPNENNLCSSAINMFLDFWLKNIYLFDVV
jgi:hypothetical protein